MSKVESAGTTGSAVHNHKYNLCLMALTLIIVGVAGVLFLNSFINHIRDDWALESPYEKAQTILLGAIFFYFIFASCLYHVCRFICGLRELSHRPLHFSELDPYVISPQGRPVPRVAILVPAYKEEIDVIRQTVLSAVFQYWPHRRVVLLLDDPPHAQNPREQLNAELARALPQEIERLLAPPRARIESLASRFADSSRYCGEYQSAAQELSRLWLEIAQWFEEFALQYDETDHVHKLIRERIYLSRADDLRHHAEFLARTQELDLNKEYRRLRDLFDVEVSVFERKRYANLSHEPNKAMNLNAYLHLIGKSWHEELQGEQCFLRVTEDGSGADIRHEADAEYVIVLDADSLLGPNYAAQLVAFMEQPGHSRVAIVQSPYATAPNAPGHVERVAGAQTDTMYWSHQGMTAFGAGSWVGAAALIRLQALREIAEVTIERGHPVIRYVKDRTVTEDADTTLDLLMKGWRVHNYPQRLNYSATPADFGSFLIQRRRWATGGLLITPKLLRYLLQAPSPRRFLEVGLRTQFLLSDTISCIASILLLVFPFSRGLEVPAVLLAFSISAQLIEFSQLGHRKRDVFGLYALSLALIPIHLSGAWHSFKQLVTGRRGRFSRTPKVSYRTSVPRHHVMAQCLLLAMFAGKAVLYLIFAHNWSAGFSAALGTALMVYALTRFLGLRNAWIDVIGRTESERILSPSAQARPAASSDLTS